MQRIIVIEMMKQLEKYVNGDQVFPSDAIAQDAMNRSLGKVHIIILKKTGTEWAIDMRNDT